MREIRKRKLISHSVNLMRLSFGQMLTHTRTHSVNRELSTLETEKEIFESSSVLSLILKILDLHVPKYDAFIGLKIINK
jgi:hypothetical protein